MTIIFYTTRAASPAARTVETIIRILKLDVKRREINLLKQENLEPWFAKLNPARMIPVLDDNGYVLTDRYFNRSNLDFTVNYFQLLAITVFSFLLRASYGSIIGLYIYKVLKVSMFFFSHAITAYLLHSYAPKDILEQYYPTEPKQRGIVDSGWHFENGTLFARMKAIVVPLMLRGVQDIPLEKTQSLAEAVDILEGLLEGKEWLAGDRLTVADISAITTVDLIELLIPLKHYKNVSAWVARVRKACPFYEEIGREQLDNFTTVFKKTTYDTDGRWNQIQSSFKK